MSLQNNAFTGELIGCDKQDLLKKWAFVPIITGGFIFSSVLHASEPLLEAAKDTAKCRTISDQTERLACFDAATEKLASLVAFSLDTSPQTASTVAKAITKTETKVTTTESPAPVMSTTQQRTTPAEPAVQNAVTSVTAPTETSPQPEKTQTETTTPQVDGDLPTWAAGPQFSDAERAQDVASFEASIVRITRNKAGRHKFYTEDGAVWEQTQIVKIRAPRSLPAMAEFKRRSTGNPTISFENSSRTYRVRRVE